MKPPLVKRLQLENYKSVQRLDLALEPLTLLVGRNAAGKSNIVDALRFTVEALQNSLEYAMRERGGIDEVRRRSLGSRPPNFAVDMELSLPEGGRAKYRFKIAAMAGRRFRVGEERCEVVTGAGKGLYWAQNSKLKEWTLNSPAPAISDDRLLLVAASGLPELRPLWDALSHMTFHNFNPELMKRPQKPEPGDRLARDGHNLASVVKHLGDEGPDRLERVAEYLRAVGVPIKHVGHKQPGSYETLEFAQEVRIKQDKTKSWTFDAAAMSDGTIRALGILVSLLSADPRHGRGPTLVGIEEPETALHPAAAGALVDALLEATESTQVVLTCHSPDLLDREGVVADMIRVVISDNGVTQAGPLSKAKSELLRKHLSTAGELHRLDQLTPDPQDLQRQTERRGTLWEFSD